MHVAHHLLNSMVDPESHALFLSLVSLSLAGAGKLVAGASAQRRVGGAAAEAGACLHPGAELCLAVSYRFLVLRGNTAGFVPFRKRCVILCWDGFNAEDNGGMDDAY